MSANLDALKAELAKVNARLAELDYGQDRLKSKQGHKRLDPFHASGQASAWIGPMLRERERECPSCHKPRIRFMQAPRWSSDDRICRSCYTVVSGSRPEYIYTVQHKGRRAPNIAPTV